MTAAIIIGVGLALAAVLAAGLQMRGRRPRGDLGTMSERWVAEHRRWHSDP